MKTCIIILMFLFSCALLFSAESITLISKQFDEFYAIQPSNRSLLGLKTVCRVGYDQDNIYIFWEAEIDSNFNKSKKGRKDEFQDTDFLRTQIGTLPGDSFVYVFYVYPDGSITDAIRDRNFNVSTNWDSNAKVQNSFSDSLWTSKLTIPFKDLRYNRKAPHIWDFSFCRQFYDANTLYSSPFLSISEMGTDYFKNGHKITIDKQLPLTLNTQIIPYYAPVYDFKNSEGFYKKDQMGLDINFKPASLVNMKISVNPDFSDVPPDRAQNVFNLKNKLYLRENRYFFTEDLNVFNIDSDIFYTRNIVQPEFAAKINGTSDALTYGMMYCKDKDSDAQEFKDNHYYIATVKPKWDDKELSLSYIRQDNDFFSNTVFQFNPAYYISSNTSIIWENNITLYQDTTSVKKGIDSFIKFYTRNRNSNHYFKLGFYTKDFIAEMGRIYDPSIAYSEYSFNYSDDSFDKWESLETSFWIEPTYTTDPFKPLKINTGFYLKLDPHGPFYADFNISYTCLNENNKYFHLPQTRNYISYKLNKHDLFFGFFYSLGKDYIWSLEEEQIYTWIEPSINYTPNPYFNLYASVLLYHYPYLTDSDKEILDDTFPIVNIEMKNYLLHNLNLASGISYIEYFAGDYNYYCNLQYNITRDIALYAGLSKKASEFNRKWETEYNTFYLKFRAVFNL